MHQVKQLEVREGYELHLLFEDGRSKTINIEPFIGKGFTDELLSLEEFKKAFIEPGGGVAWPNGFDLCPNFLYELQPSENSLA
ncbi:MAG: DUF2442 domain-containing protein [Bacteroidota bacterium]